jgi:hypothetical protein
MTIRKIMIAVLLASTATTAANAKEIIGWQCGNVVIHFTSGNLDKPAFTFEIEGLKEPNPKFVWWWPLKEGDDKLTLNGKECETRYSKN